MPLIEWDSAFSVGNNEMDEHHKKFFHVINKLYDSMKTGEKEEILPTVLKELQQYVQYHFKAEEALMKMYAYPDYSSHKAEHDDAVQKINKFMIRYDRKEDNLTIEVLNFLSTWLQNHILQTDRKYIPYLNKKI
jgi:hemerythrin